MRIFILLSIFALGLISCAPKESEKDLYTKAQELYRNQKFEEAVFIYELMLEDYTDGEYAPKAAFMMAYIYANELDDLTNARKYYELFLERYGAKDENLAASAKWELEHLGESVQDFEVIRSAPQDTTK